MNGFKIGSQGETLTYKYPTFTAIEARAPALPAEYVAAARALRAVMGARLRGTRRERKLRRAAAFARWERVRSATVKPTRAERRFQL